MNDSSIALTSAIETLFRRRRSAEWGVEEGGKTKDEEEKGANGRRKRRLAERKFICFFDTVPTSEEYRAPAQCSTTIMSPLEIG